MDTAFDPQAGEWQIGWPGRVARHDLVYLSPPVDPMQGIPLGNGEIGALCWCEDTRIVIAVNRSDHWDDAPYDRFQNWQENQEDTSTAQRHACRIILDFQLPVFDFFYLTDFKGRLSLSDGSLHLEATGPLGSVCVRGFLPRSAPVIRLEVSTDLSENVPTEVRVERFGSRTFGHWYSLINRDATIGLPGTEATADDDAAFVTHQLTRGRFAVGMQVAPAGGAEVRYDRRHSRCAAATVTGGARQQYEITVAVTAPLAEDPVPAARAELDAAAQRGLAADREAQCAWWRAFWMRSLMECGDDYLDNLWHLTMYYAAASQGGTYPGRFINGLWTWSRDVQPWTFYFHWNQQQTYWPLNAAGHHDLASSYLDYRFRALPEGRRDAAEWFGAPGALASDVCDGRGHNSRGEAVNHTPVAQIALDFWRHYQYTGDRAFLCERALPYITEAACYFESLFDLGDDGMYHATEGVGYEGGLMLRDGITEIACGKVLFDTALLALADAGADHPRAAAWRDLASRMAPMPTLAVEDTLIGEQDGQTVYRRGFFKGDPARGSTILASGYGIEDRKLLCSRVAAEPSTPAGRDVVDIVKDLEANETPHTALREDMKGFDGVFPVVETAAVFPSGPIGLANAGEPMFDAAVNTARLYAPDCMGWDPLPIMMARLGLAREARAILDRWPDRWQYYVNGWGHYGPRDIMRADAALANRTTLVHDASDPARGAWLPFPAWPFRHMGMEAMSVLACALNETLLQSHDGVIRVAPAADPACDARFTLHATGGFVVSAELKAGAPQWVCIESLRGGVCRVANPWPHAWANRAGAASAGSAERTLEFETAPGERILLAPAEGVLDTWSTAPETPAASAAPKNSPVGRASLGLPRMF